MGETAPLVVAMASDVSMTRSTSRYQQISCSPVIVTDSKAVHGLHICIRKLVSVERCHQGLFEGRIRKCSAVSILGRFALGSW